MMRSVQEQLPWGLVALAIAACGPKASRPVTEPAAEPAETDVEPAATEPAGTPSDSVIPREILFGNPDRRSVGISFDGTKLAFRAPKDGVMNVWVGPVDDSTAAEPVTDERERPIRAYRWAHDNEHILYEQVTGGDESFHVYSVDVDSGETRDLTPVEGVAARITKTSYKKPGQVVISMNDRDPELHDLYVVDIATGEREKLLENPGFRDVEIDDDFRVRIAREMTPEGGAVWKTPAENGDGWEELVTVPPEDQEITEILALDAEGDEAFIRDSRGRDTAALARIDLSDGEVEILAEHPNADADSVLLHPTSKKPQAVGFTYLRTEWKALDSRLKPDFDRLRPLGHGELHVVSRTLDDSVWIVVHHDDDGPIGYYRYQRKPERTDPELLFVSQSELEEVELAPMHPLVIESRDGLELVSYLTLPKGTDPDGDARPAEPVPMVLLVHGGPWNRDRWGYEPTHQWLADRGYAVLSVNFRGSAGFGKDFLDAGNEEWGRKMHDDLVDGVRWAIEAGVADEDRVCIMGGSYGGYATLVGVTMTPELFACGVDIVGPSNIITLLESIPPDWTPMVEKLEARVGDWTDEQDRAMLEARSPLTHVDQIEAPLLIAQGANDPRVKKAEADQIVEAMQDRGIPVTYVLFPDEGHGLARVENRMAFFAVTEAFLSVHLGGVYQPFTGEDFEGSSIQVPAGVEGVPGLRAVLPQ